MPVKFVFYPPQRDNISTWAARLSDSVPEISIIVPKSDAEAKQAMRDADAAFGTLPKDALALAGKLRWLQAPAAAPTAGYYYPELIKHQVVVTNFREIYNDHIATHIMAFVVSFARGLQYYRPQQLRREWKPTELDGGIVHLPEATALIVGVGGIGGEAARLCAPFGIRVIGVDARRTDMPEGVAEMHRPEDLDKLLPKADFVILTIPHTPKTEGLFNAARFKLMKKGAFFINIGRGMTTKLDALNDSLRSGHLGGAGLDVYEIEPLPKDHPLWGAPNVLLTPHTAGFGPYLEERRYEIVLDNMRRFVKGQALRNVVDKASWF